MRLVVKEERSRSHFLLVKIFLIKRVI